MAGWDVAPVTSLNLGLLQRESVDEDEDLQQFKSITLSQVDAQARFRHFLRVHKSEDGSTFPYREQLKNNYIQGQFFLPVDLFHLYHHDPQLHDLLLKHPADYLPSFEVAATEVAKSATGQLDHNPNVTNEIHDLFNYRQQGIQIQLIHCPIRTPIRHLNSTHVSKLVSIKGIVVSAGRPRIKPTTLEIVCRSCKATKKINAGGGFGGVRLPRKCDSRNVPGGPADALQCPLDPYIILPDATLYIDQQRLKLQELNEDVPTGELPRHLSLSCDRYLVGAVKPGSRVVITGLYTTYESNAAADAQNGATDVGIRIPYIRVFGIESELDEDSWIGAGFNGTLGNSISDPLSMDDDDEMLAIARQPDLYQKIANSMCPAIFDNEDTRNIKQALAVQLFGGSRKILPDGMRLRGDINILLLGDPSVAKSQFLKFVSAAAPIGVYTSGKGSSAAGLTASVVRDPGSGEFHLEGGALVLADGGLVAIDEFDKMREQDRVAIHEAMEQQTISIAKAGITTILNSRTAVLAAANPIFGRYDDMKSPTENIDFQTSILSRFDLIFIVRDVQNDQRDMALAKHILNVHRYRDAAIEEMQANGESMVEIPILKKYIAYAKKHCQPRLTAEAAETLKNQYVRYRQSIAREQNHSTSNSSTGIIPITVRQLEAVVRISEALARMELSDLATSKHVTEALRLFQVSTYRAALHQGHSGGHSNDHTSGINSSLVGSAEFDRSVRMAEKDVRYRLPAGNTMATMELVKYLVENKNIPKIAAERAIENMTNRNELAFLKMRKLVKRL